MMTSVIEQIEQHVTGLAGGNDPKVKPGQPELFTEACVQGDQLRQGDLYLTLVDAVPAGYVRITKPKAADKQLVPGNTRGSRHCLDSLNGVVIHRPADWNEASMFGPCLVLTQERTILHPVHGAVTVLPGQTVRCDYQRVWNAEQKQQRRARD